MQLAPKFSDQYTRCPHCGTLYSLFRKVKIHLLKVVSCGTCQNTFNVQNALTVPEHKIILPNRNNPYCARLLATTNTTQPTVGEPLLPWRKWLTVAAILLGINAMVGIVVWLTSHSLMQNTHVQQAISTVCTVLNCASTANTVLHIEQHKIVSVPQNPTALQLQVTIKNTSSITQSLTNLQVHIKDLPDETTKTLIFTPAEYMLDSTRLMLAPGEVIHVTVALHQAPTDVFTYQVNFI